MENLSSDTLYYKNFAGLIFGPFIIALFIKVVWVLPNAVAISSYTVVAVYTFYQWYRWPRYKKVSLDNGNLLIKTYFTNKSILVPIANVYKIEKGFSLGRRDAKTSYNMTFLYNNVERKVSFFRSATLYDISDLDRL